GFEVEADPAAGPRENVSWGRRLLLPARLVNRFCARNVGDKQVAVSLLPDALRRGLFEALNRGWLAGAAPEAEKLLGPDLVAEIHARCAAGNRRLAAERGLPLARHGYPGCDAPRGGPGSR